VFLWPFRPKKTKNDQESKTSYKFEGDDNDSAMRVISKLHALNEPDNGEDEEAHEDVGESCNRSWQQRWRPYMSSQLKNLVR